MDNPHLPKPPEATAAAADIPVDLAMLYTLWGRAVLLRQADLAEELEALLFSAGAAASTNLTDAGALEAALAGIGPRDVPFERSAMDLNIARLVAALSSRSEFRLFSLRGTEVAGYLLRQQRVEYVGTPRRHLVRHDRVNELLPPRTAMSAFNAVSRGHRADHAFRTDFDVPSQLVVSLGIACARYKLYESPHFHHARLYLYRELDSANPVDEPVPVRLVRRQSGSPIREQAIECTQDADLLRLHAALHQASWVHLETTAFSLLARLPSMDAEGSTTAARYDAHRTLRTLTGIYSSIALPIPRTLAMRFLRDHRWFAPQRSRDWRTLLAAVEAEPKEPYFDEEPEGWLVS